MRTGIAILVGCALLGGCAYTHRRVIRAKLRNEPMPKAPQWHFWVAPEQRRP